MTPDQANDLAFRLATSWPKSSVAIEAWRDAIMDLHYAPAEATYRDLVNTQEFAPTIAAFRGTYGRKLGTAHDGPACPDCGNTGLITDRDHPQHWPGDPSSVPKPIDAATGKPTGECACNVAKPCHCRTGQTHGRALIAAINAHRSKEQHAA